MSYNTTDPSKDDFIGCWIYSNEGHEAGFYDATLVPHSLALASLEELSRGIREEASIVTPIPRLKASLVSLHKDKGLTLLPHGSPPRMFILRKSPLAPPGGNRKLLHLEAVENGQDPLERLRLLQQSAREMHPHTVVINGVEYFKDKPTGDH